MNKHSKLFFLFVFLILFFSFYPHQDTSAYVGYGTGGSTTSGGSGSGNPITMYDCYSINMCPHWIKVPTDVFKSMVANGRVNGTYSDTSVCTGDSNNDGYVVFSGKFYNDLYYMHNWISTTTLNPTKESHIYLEYYDNSVRHIGNFLNQTTKDGMTYGTLLNTIKSTYGVSEKDLAFFCSGMLSDQSSQFYSESNVSNREDSIATDTSNYTSTGVATSGTASTSLDVDSLGASIIITFSHNLFSDTAQEGVSYRIERTLNGNSGFSNNNVDISMPASTSNSSNSTRDSTSGSGIKFENKASKTEGTFYIGEPRSYTDGQEGDDHTYILRDYYQAQINAVGTYKFCETVYIKPQGGTEKQYTQACSDITVTDGGNSDPDPTPTETGYYGQSTGAIDNSIIADTGITNSNITASSDTYEVETGNSAVLTFGHNVYSAPASSDSKKWNITRNFPSSGIDISKKDFTSSGTASSFSAACDNGYYAPSCSENVVDNSYDITFSTAGEYQFCETLSLDGSNLSTACINIKVTDSPDSSVCDQWTPDSYTNSTTKIGTTSVLAKVKNTTLGEDWLDGPTYAKPGDKVEWLFCYYPGVQKTYETKASTNGYICSVTLTAYKEKDENNNEKLRFKVTGSECNNRLYYLSSSLKTIANFMSGDFTINTSSTTTKEIASSSSFDPSISNTLRIELDDDAKTLLKELIGNIDFTNITTITSKLKEQDIDFTALVKDAISAVVTNLSYSWENNFTITTTGGAKNITNTASKIYDWIAKITSKGYDVGDTTVRSSTKQVSIVDAKQKAQSDVSQKITKTIKSSSPSYIEIGGEAIQSNPKSLFGEFLKKVGNTAADIISGDFVAIERINTPAESSASAIVPYNFKNTAIAIISGDYVYAGEQATITDEVYTWPKQNGLVGNKSYSTRVDNAKINLITYVSSSPYGTEIEHGDPSQYCSVLGTDCYSYSLAEGINLNYPATGILSQITSLYLIRKSDSYPKSKTTNVFDATAGQYYCARTAVFPSTSGSDDNTNEAGSNDWYISVPSCKVIAKKPSFQVWGSSMFVNGKVNTNTSDKYVLGSQYEDKMENTTPTTFGSWTELSILHPQGSITNLASGAATSGGYRQAESGKADFCKYGIFLTIPNTDCTNSTVSAASSINSDPNDREAIYSYFTTNENSIPNLKLESGKTTITSNEAIETLWLSPYKVKIGQTVFYDSKGKDFTIDKNIEYETPSGGYSSIAEIPKLIIYAENITISCNVTRVDAILIAKNEVKTCNNYSSKGNATDPLYNIRSHQLTINGTIIADKLTLGRTYGAATGDNSGTPAEIINYDSSIYLWGRQRSESGATGDFTTVYQTELAPRY